MLLSKKEFAAITGMLMQLEFNQNDTRSEMLLCGCLNYSMGYF